MRRTREPSETEAALLVLAGDPVPVLRRLRNLRALGPFSLVPRPLSVIEDRYWDTKDHILGRKQLALRVREYDGDPWITAKGPSKRTVGRKTVERFEVEMPWQRSVVRKKLVPLLENFGVLDASALEHGTWPTHRRAMTKMGLFPIQRRMTRRWPRDVFRSGRQSKAPLAEMAIDVVTYRIGSLSPKFAEVEIEMKGVPRRDAVEQFISLLLSQEGVTLMPLRAPKLAIGRALTSFALNGELAPKLGPHGWLTQNSFRAIRQALSRGLV